MRLIQILDVDDGSVVGYVAVGDGVTAETLTANYKARKPKGVLMFEDLGTNSVCCILPGSGHSTSVMLAVKFACELEEAR